MILFTNYYTNHSIYELNLIRFTKLRLFGFNFHKTNFPPNLWQQQIRLNFQSRPGLYSGFADELFNGISNLCVNPSSLVFVTIRLNKSSATIQQWNLPETKEQPLVLLSPTGKTTEGKTETTQLRQSGRHSNSCVSKKLDGWCDARKQTNSLRSGISDSEKQFKVTNSLNFQYLGSFFLALLSGWPRRRRHHHRVHCLYILYTHSWPEIRMPIHSILFGRSRRKKHAKRWCY